MDVEQRSGQLYSSSELSSVFIGLPISNSRNMNQLRKESSHIRKQKKKMYDKKSDPKTPRGNCIHSPSQTGGRLSNHEVLPKIETCKSANSSPISSPSSSPPLSTSPSSPVSHSSSASIPSSSSKSISTKLDDSGAGILPPSPMKSKLIQPHISDAFATPLINNNNSNNNNNCNSTVQEWLHMPLSPSSEEGSSQSNNTEPQMEHFDNHINNNERRASVKSFTVSSTESVSDMLTQVNDSFTDRTSATSSEWGDEVCEFERKETHRVDQMFEEIECMFYNDSSSPVRTASNRATRSTSVSERSGFVVGPVHLIREVNDWKSQFPHFRLIGKSLTSSTSPTASSISLSTPLSSHLPHLHQSPILSNLSSEQGYSFHDTERPGSVTPRNSPRIIEMGSVSSPNQIASSRSDNSKTTAPDSIDYDKLSVVGHGIQSIDFVSNAGLNELQESGVCSSLEEIFEKDGDLVEVIAIDYKMDDEEFNIDQQRRYKSRNPVLRSNKGFPPITPNAVMRDGVVTAVFDNLWSQIVEWLVPLFGKSIISRDMIIMDSYDANSYASGFMSPEGYFRYSKTGLSSFINPNISSVSAFNNLSNVLKISSKTLQFREKSNLQSIPEQPNTNSNYPYSYWSNNLIKSSQNPPSKRRVTMPQQMQDRSSTPMSLHDSIYNLEIQSQRNSNLSYNQQHQLIRRTNHMSQSTLMNSDNLAPIQCLRGRALNTSSQSPDLVSRCGTLPPIINSKSITNNAPINSHQWRTSGTRIGSAQTNTVHQHQHFHNSLTHQYNNTNNNSTTYNHQTIQQAGQSQEYANNTRPCTSQTARSEMLLSGNRSSTPIGASGGGGTYSLTTNTKRHLNLNVLGSSISVINNNINQLNSAKLNDDIQHHHMTGVMAGLNLNNHNLEHQKFNVTSSNNNNNNNNNNTPSNRPKPYWKLQNKKQRHSHLR